MAGLSIYDSSLTSVNQMIAALWRQRFAEAQNNLPWQNIATDMGKSNAQTRAFDWFGEVPEMVDVTRRATPFGGIARHNYTISHTEYAIGLSFRISDLATDQLGQIPPRVAGAARKAAGHPGRLVFDQLEDNPTAFDSATYFANTHAFGSAANYDNNLAGNGTTTSAIETDLNLARVAMMNAQDDTGESMGNAPDTLVIPVNLGVAFRKVLGGFREVGGVDNTLGAISPGEGTVWTGGGFTVIELPSSRLSDTDNWYAFHTGGEIKPFIYTWITQPAPLNTPSFNDESAKHNARLEYVFYGEYAVGVSLPQYGVLVTN